MELCSFPRINSPIPQEGWISIILAAGKGTRMGSDRNKVCHLVGGIPVINRTIATLKNWGFKVILVIVGHKYDELIATVEKEFSDVNFLLQKEQKGTGHAVKCACEFLKSQGFRGNLLIIAGDKIVDGRFLREMRDRFESEDYDLLIATSICEGKSFGRIVRGENGEVQAIIESKGREGEFPAYGETNQSIYMVKTQPLYEDIWEIKADEHSGEEQFTDIVAIFHRNGRRIETHEIPKESILTYNTPWELEEIEALAGKVHFISECEPLLNERNLKPAGEWLKIFKGMNPNLLRSLRAIYGRDELVYEKIGYFSNLLEEWVKMFGGGERVFLIRSPGKLNILGRHIDHRGGRVNSIAIDKEILMVVKPGDDDVLEIFNLDGRFPARSFSIGMEMEKFDWGHWMDIYPNEEVDGRTVWRGDWVLYAKAIALRFQERFRDRRIKGFRALVWGNIPFGSGLSSSSALVVAFAEALRLANGISIAPEHFVTLCGEGEWFVGTRGGMGDHAGIKMGKLFSVNQFSFHPFSYIGSALLPKGYVFIFAYSYEEARKAEGAREKFNQKVACYEIGTRLLRKNIPEIQHLRDLHPEELGLGEEEIFRLMKSLPLKMSRQEIVSELGDEGEEILARHHCLDEEYPIRGVCLFGVAECARSRMCIDLLKAGDILSLAELINISHDGDRVSRLDENGRRVPYSNDVSDDYLEYLIEKRRREPHRKEFSLPYQPGNYACSTPGIDHMVDSALKVEGVLGAQILGAGLGGSIMVLAREESVEELRRALIKNYYEPRGYEPLMGVCIPIQGAGCIELSD